MSPMRSNATILRRRCGQSSNDWSANRDSVTKAGVSSEIRAGQQTRREDSSKGTLPQILASLSTLVGEQQQIVWQQSVIGSSVPVFLLLYSSLKLVRICGSYALQQ